jgi:hypothetical protein
VGSKRVVGRVRVLAAFVFLPLACTAGRGFADPPSGHEESSEARIGISDAQVAQSSDGPEGTETEPSVEAPGAELEQVEMPEGEDPKSEEPEEDLTEAELEEARETATKEDELSIPEAIAERRASEYAYTNLSLAQAEELLRERHSS